ncbi:MAG: hypothetical protein J0H51_19190, partial [Rhizobiales bacterium]|nr:hypothetical protein [Hyphomicrobiales bacterium]
RLPQRGFVDWLYGRDTGVVTRRLVREHGDTPAVRSVLRAQRDYVTELNALPSDAGCWKNRGRDSYYLQTQVIPCLPPLGRNATAEERADRRKALQGEGGRRSRKITEQIHRGLIAEEIENRLAAGVPVVEAEVVKALVKAGTVSRSTTYAHFDAVFEVVRQSARYQVSLPATNPEQSNNSSTQAANSHASEPSDIRIPVINLDSARCLVEDNGVIRRKPSNLHLRTDYDAYRIRNSWRMAVAAWRQARNPDHGGEIERPVRRKQHRPTSSRSLSIN